MKPLLTVGLPVYNGMPYLPEAIASLLQQEEGRFELVAIDDGSTDDSLSYLLSISDPRVTVFSQSHCGITTTLNRILKAAKTPWLVRHDADDIAYPTRLTRVVEYIQKYPDAGMFYSLADYTAGRQRSGLFRCTRGAPDAIRRITTAGYLLAICHPAVTLNVSKSTALGGYRFDMHVEDVDLWWRMALRHEIRLIPEIGVTVRSHLASVSARNLYAQTLDSVYIQYLLISHLRGRKPREYESVRPILHGVVARSSLQFRTFMRRANSALATRQLWSAGIQLSRALISSPRDFWRRLFYEIKASDEVYNGIDPATFDKHADRLWTGADMNEVPDAVS